MYHQNSLHIRHTEELGGKWKIHSSYIQREFNDKKDMIINIFSAYVEPLLKDINHPEFLQERKPNLDAADYNTIFDANLYKPSEKTSSW